MSRTIHLLKQSEVGKNWGMVGSVPDPSTFMKCSSEVSASTQLISATLMLGPQESIISAYQQTITAAAIKNVYIAKTLQKYSKEIAMSFLKAIKGVSRN